MQTSNFQFSDPRLVKLVFEVDNTYEADKGEAVDINVNVLVNVSKQEDVGNAIVELQIELDSEESPFRIVAVESANFKWDPEGFNDNMVEKMLNQNAPALLLAYLRPIIANITGSSGYGTYNLPFINFANN